MFTDSVVVFFENFHSNGNLFGIDVVTEMALKILRVR